MGAGLRSALPAVAGVCHPPDGTLSRPAVLANVDGRFEVAVRCAISGGGSAVAYNTQLSPAGGWAGWTVPASSAVASDITMVANRNGRLETFARGSDGAMWHAVQSVAGGPWSGWSRLGGSRFAGSPVAARNVDGRLEVFIRGADGTLWHTWQTAPASAWSGFASLGGSVASDPAVAVLGDGRLDVFVRAADASIRHASQNPAGGWLTWASLAGVSAGPAAIGKTPEGRLEVYVRGTNGLLYHALQQSTGGFSAWGRLGGPISGDPTVARNANLRQEVFAPNASGVLSHIWQLSPGGSWSTWAPLTGASGNRPSVGVLPDGRLEVFAVDASGRLWHTWQQTTGGWSPGFPLADAIVPPATASHYLTWSGNAATDDAKAYQIGCRDGTAGVRGVHVLAYGTQETGGVRQPGTTASSTTPRIGDNRVVATARQYVAGFLACRPSAASTATVALGVNNKSDGGLAATTAGSRWAAIVNNVAAAVHAGGWDRAGITIAAANDLEPSWGTPTAARQWIAAFTGASTMTVYDYGSADGCPAYGSTSVTCANGWTLADLFAVSTGAARTLVALPEIYTPSGTQARQWSAISAWGVHHGAGQVRFAGAFSTWTACQQRGGCTGRIDNTPSTSWSQLWTELRAHADTSVNVLPAASDIRWE
jgi:hypothetical protein